MKIIRFKLNWTIPEISNRQLKSFNDLSNRNEMKIAILFKKKNNKIK